MQLNKKTISFGFIAFIFALINLCQPTMAADASSIQRDTERLNNRNLPPAAQPRAVEPVAPTSTSGAQVKVAAFEFTGATLVDNASLQAEVAQYIGQTLDYAALNLVTRKVSQFYQAKGWLAKVYLPEQNIENGIITIAINEAKLGKVRSNSPSGLRIDTQFASKMLTQTQQNSAAINTKALERALLLMNDSPGFSANATLLPGAENSETDIILNLADKPIFNAKVWGDNYGSRAIGKARANAQASFNNLTGYGDQLSIYGIKSRGLEYVQGGYEFPLGYAGTRLNMGGAVSNYELHGKQLSELNANGESYSYHVGVKHPIIRSRFANLIFVGNATSLSAKDEVLGLQVSDKRYHSFSMGLRGDRSDNFGLGGVFWAGASLTMGNLDLSRNRDDKAADAISARTDGRYSKLNLYLGRQQLLADKLTGKALLSAQLADTNLGGFEKFSLGGPNGLQGFAVGEAAADQGWMLNLETRYAIQPNWGLSLLGDAGGVCLNKKTWAGWNAANPSLDNCYPLASAGLGVDYQVQNIEAKLAYAKQMIGNAGLDSNNRNVEGEKRKQQLWLQIGASF